MDSCLEYVKKLNECQSEVRITMTHVLAHACAWGMYKMRRDIGRLRWGSFQCSDELGVTVLVDKEGGKDLVPVTLWDGHKMNIIEVAQHFQSKVDRARKGKDERHNKTVGLADYIPTFITEPFGFAATYLGAAVGIPLPCLGLHKKAFGQIVLTNVGTLGYHSAIAPLCPVTHQQALICTGKIEKRAYVDTKDGDKVKVANFMTSIGTGDHRFGDAAIFVPFFKTMQRFIDDPMNFDHTQCPENCRVHEKKGEVDFEVKPFSYDLKR